MKEHGVRLSDVYRYLGCHRGEPDPCTQQQILQWEAYLKAFAPPKMVTRTFPIVHTSAGVQVENTTLVLPGADSQTLLAESHHCILMAVTLGQELERKLRELQLQDMAQAVILDACASSFVEEACNQLEEKLTSQLKNGFFTDRFSPGYGDLPLSLQPLLCQVLQTSQKIGLSVDNRHIMRPGKSITAILGIANIPQPMKIKGCGVCRLRNSCTYRKGGITCGS